METTIIEDTFIETWNRCEGRRQVAIALHWPLCRVQAFAQKMRRKGIKLKRFEKFREKVK